MDGEEKLDVESERRGNGGWGDNVWGWRML